MARNETEKPFTVQLLGVHNQMIIVTAPVHPNGSLMPVLPGQAWSCRTFQMTSAFRLADVIAGCCADAHALIVSLDYTPAA